MFFGHISNIVANRYPKAVLAALEYIKNTDFGRLEAGRYPLTGDAYMQVLNLHTKTKEECLPEVHRQYLDVQYWISGMERMGVAPDLGNNKVAQDYDAERDVLFYSDSENEQEIVCHAGNFAVFFPEDVHRGACRKEEISSIRKVVIKVAISEL